MTCSSHRLKIILAAVILNLYPPFAAPAQTSQDSGAIPREFLEKARASMVVLTGEDKAGLPVAPGVGFWIGRNLIATDNRVVQSAVRIHVTVPGQESNQLEVTSLDNYRLASVLTVTRAPAASPLLIGDSDKAVVNDKVYLVGDSASKGPASERSLAKTVILNGGRYFQVAAPMSSASRGGPVLNNKGEVIGIAGEGPGGLSETFIIPAEYLTALLRDRNVGKAGGGMGSGGGMGPGQGSNEGKGMGMGAAPSTGPGQGNGVVGGTAESGGQQSNAVDTKPVVLKGFNPRYTEEARRNQVQGVVTLRILVGEDGNVKRVTVVRGLPDGLSEQALAGAYQMKFKPATRNGVAVSHWMVVQAEFNLR